MQNLHILSKLWIKYFEFSSHICEVTLQKGVTLPCRGGNRWKVFNLNLLKMKNFLKKVSLLIAFGGISVSALAMGAGNGILELLSLNEAKAICCSTPINNGRCSYFNNCFGDPGGENTCDTTKGNCDSKEEEILP